MKIQIDLNEILGDPEYGVETLQDSVRRQVVAALTQKISTGIEKKIDSEVAKDIDESIKKNIESLTPQIFKDMLEAEYVPVDRYGDRKHGEKTTMRKQLVAVIQENMTYKKTSYSSDKNNFTRVVDEVLHSKISDFKSAFDKTINEMFVKECFEYAQNKLQAKLGIK